MVTLPFELLTEITLLVPASTGDLRQLRSVNKAFHNLATPIAFKSLTVHTTDKSSRGFRNLLNSPNLARYVQDITLVEDPSPFSAKDDENVKYDKVRDSLKAAFSILHQLPALASLALFFHPNLFELGLLDRSLPQPRFVLLQWDVLSGLACNPNPLPSLRSLTIDKWLPLPHSLYYQAPFTHMVASLRHLRVFVYADDNEGAYFEEPLVEFWEEVVERQVLRRAVNLESLEIDSNLEYGSGPCINFNEFEFPCLTALSLKNAVWEDGTAILGSIIPGVEDFVVRHGKTLKRLELWDCTIVVCTNTPTRHWAAIWNRFAETLTELVDLVVRFRKNLPKEDKELRYVYLSAGHGFIPLYEGLAGTDEDEPALEVLKEIVEGRKMAFIGESHE